MDKKLQRVIITASVVVVAALAAFKILKTKSPNQGGDGGNQGGEGGGNQGGGTGGNGSGVSGLDYRALAKKIFDACDGYGTSEDTIVDVFKELRNNADFDALSNAYGVREVSSGTWNVFQSNFQGNLSSTLRNELSSSWINDLNEILSSKGITRRV